MRRVILACSFVAAARAPARAEAPDLGLMLRDAARLALPPDVEIVAVHVDDRPAMRGDPVAIEVEAPRDGRFRGRTMLRARIRAGKETRLLTFAADLRSPAREPVVRSGAAVTVVARSGAVTVSAAGRAQQDGAVGERIHVICPALHRVIEARVIDASFVEVP